MSEAVGEKNETIQRLMMLIADDIKPCTKPRHRGNGGKCGCVYNKVWKRVGDWLDDEFNIDWED